MSKAMEQLVDTDEMIRTIAEQVGYSNVNSFVRIFKKITGLTPTEYRAKNKERNEPEHEQQ
ncbi:DNA-binding transcriptional regulator AraC [compost metagenome]